MYLFVFSKWDPSALKHHVKLKVCFMSVLFNLKHLMSDVVRHLKKLLGTSGSFRTVYVHQCLVHKCVHFAPDSGRGAVCTSLSWRWLWPGSSGQASGTVQLCRLELGSKPRGSSRRAAVGSVTPLAWCKPYTADKLCLLTKGRTSSWEKRLGLSVTAVT